MLFLSPAPPQSRISSTYVQHIARGGGRYNGGIDYAIPEGTIVTAPQGGKVVRADFDKGYGEHVRIDHGFGYLTICGHLMDITVAIDQIVHAGDAIGVSGNTGSSSSPHLHYELRLRNTPIDPQPLLTSGAIYDPTMPPSVMPFEPLAPRLKVVTRRLWIRESPSVESRKIIPLDAGAEVGVIKIINDIWACVGYKQYIAMRQDSDYLAVWVTDGK